MSDLFTIKNQLTHGRFWGILGWIWLMIRWTDDPVRQHGKCRWLGRRGRSGIPPLDEDQTSGGEGGECSRSKLCNNEIKRLGIEGSMYEVGTSTLHNSDKPHGLVDSKT